VIDTESQLTQRLANPSSNPSKFLRPFGAIGDDLDHDQYSVLDRKCWHYAVDYVLVDCTLAAF
jgi:hypothetical protein